jgi:HAD superfamily hydrolase (TIGR01509 family)
VALEVIMSKEILKNITHVFHDWDGVYTHYLDSEAFWRSASAIAVEADIFDCEEKAMQVTQEIYRVSRDTDKPYESAYEVLHHEFNLPLDYCMKRHHEILLQDHRDNFQVLEGVAEFMIKLTHLEHIILTHSNNHWVKSWTAEAGTRQYYNHVVCCVEEGIGKKNQADKLYRQLEARFGVLPQNCLLIDDSLANLKMAHKAGWKTAWCQSNDRVSQASDETGTGYVDITYTCAKNVLSDLIEHTA